MNVRECVLPAFGQQTMRRVCTPQEEPCPQVRNGSLGDAVINPIGNTDTLA